jgi:hypothetical protein
VIVNSPAPVTRLLATISFRRRAGRA